MKPLLLFTVLTILAPPMIALASKCKFTPEDEMAMRAQPAQQEQTWQAQEDSELKKEETPRLSDETWSKQHHWERVSDYTR